MAKQILIGIPMFTKSYSYHVWDDEERIMSPTRQTFNIDNISEDLIDLCKIHGAKKVLLAGNKQYIENLISNIIATNYEYNDIEFEITED